MQDVLGVILGGGRGTRLFPLTSHRSKPAVPIGGKYRLIDIPVSNCLNSDLRRIFVLTQYNSESLNKHLNSTYKFDIFSSAFVSVLAAEQTEDSPDWFQGTADAVRQSLRHLRSHPSRDVLILSGDQLYQMDFRKMQETHRRHVADATSPRATCSASPATSSTRCTSASSSRRTGGTRRTPRPLARRAHPPRRPALPDGLPEDAGDAPAARGGRHGGGDPGARRADRGLRHPQDEPPGAHRALRGEAQAGAAARAGLRDPRLRPRLPGLHGHLPLQPDRPR